MWPLEREEPRRSGGRQVTGAVCCGVGAGIELEVEEHGEQYGSKSIACGSQVNYDEPMARVENLLGALSLTMSDRFREVGAAYRMSASEQASLVTLLAHPDQPVSWLGEVLGLTSSGVTRLVDRLVARGWVTRTPGTDARHRRLRLTSAGTKRARLLNRDREAVLTDAVAGLSAADRADLERLLDSLVGALHDDLMSTIHTCRLCDRTVCRSSGLPCPLDHTVPADV